ncbi:MAG: ATP-binding cassette domain-containing protein [Rhabdochlamydiaceae bacterium]|nr:ATP-binding cassette domain-containing protein [Rhabdochlamydiaceae bacterium]
MSEPLVSLHQLSKAFSPGTALAINEISATLPKGKIIGLAGPDGAGKTTLIRLIAGLLVPSKGTVTIAGYDSIRESEPIHDLIGYMPQKFGLYEDLTVMQNLNLYADLRDVTGKMRKETFEKLLTFTDLGSFTNRLAGNLSGGMKQKLGLACALIKKPVLLLLDEPSVGVDPISRRELWKMVVSLLDEGITVLWSTAYLNEVERCDRVLLLNQGKLLYDGAPKELTERVESRVFKVTNITGGRRKLLFELLNQKAVIDGVIQGSDLRIVMREKGLPSLCSQEHTFEIHKEEPRFEDAFIDILGGGPGGRSELAASRAIVMEEFETPVQAENLTKTFGSFTAANGISFTIKKGEIFGLLGPNGAGKSTTFKMLCGLLQPSSGRARVNGLDLAEAPGQARAQIGYMAQKFSLYGSLSVKQNLSFFAGIYHGNGRKMEEIEKMIHIFSLQEYLDATSESLPLGFKQRLSLACANMHNPPVIFLDEPTSGVDPITRREFWNHINGLVEKGVTVMVTTHFMDEAEYCDRIALIYRGKMIHMDTPDALKHIAKTDENQNPTLEDAFIQLIEEYDANNTNKKP